MFNNAAFDVAIGLIFIFLLYSLLATTINEFVAMLLAYRHRMLEKGIEQMLDGKNYSYYWWDKALNIIRWICGRVGIKAHFKNNLLPQTHLSLRQFLTNQKINDTDVHALIKPQTYVKRAKLNKKAALFASNVINHPLYRRKSEQSLLYKKPAYLSSTAFSDILMDILGGSKSSTTTDPITIDDVKNFVDSKLTGNPDLKSILNLYIQQAEGSVQKFKRLLENWYDDTMERVSGWYKRQVTKVLFLIGLVLSVMFNVSTIAIVGKLSADKPARQALVSNASDFVKSHYVDSGRHVANKEPAAPPADASDFNQVKGKLKEIDSLYRESIEQSDTLMGFGWGDYGYNKDSIRLKKDSLEYVKDSIEYKALIDKDKTYQSKKPVLAAYLKPDIWYRAGYILSQTFTIPRNWMGFLITALAICLGAPFWFDLLNRFVNIRGGGNDPGEKKSKTGASK